MRNGYRFGMRVLAALSVLLASIVVSGPVSAGDTTTVTISVVTSEGHPVTEGSIRHSGGYFSCPTCVFVLDENGQVQLDHLGTGSWVVTATNSATGTEGAAYLTMPEPGSYELTITIGDEPEPTLLVRVEDDAGNGLPGIEVSAEPVMDVPLIPWSHEGETDANGVAAFTATSGFYRIEAGTMNIRHSVAEAVEVSTEAPIAPTEVTVVLPDVAAVSVSATHAGAPLADGYLDFGPSWNHSMGAELDADGNWAGLLLPGTYLVSVQDPSSGGVGEALLTVTPDAPNHLEIATGDSVPPSLEVRVESTAGDPVAGALVRAHQPDTDITFADQTGPDGRVLMTVPTGTFELGAMSGNVQTALDDPVLVVVTGESVTEGTVVLDGIAVTIQGYEAPDVPLGFGSVSLDADSVSLDADGRWSGLLRPGTYLAELRSWFIDGQGRALFTVSPDGPNHLDITLGEEAPPRLEVTVVDSTGAPVPGTMVAAERLEPDQYFYTSGVTGLVGTAELALPPGSYTVTAYSGNVDADETPVTVDAETLTEMTLTLSQGVLASISARDETGEAITDGYLQLDLNDEQLWLGGTSEAGWSDSTWTGALRPGTYLVTLSSLSTGEEGQAYFSVGTDGPNHLEIAIGDVAGPPPTTTTSTTTPPSTTTTAPPSTTTTTTPTTTTPPAPPVTHPPARFSDVPSTAYYADAVDWLKGEKITTGVDGSNRFAPADRVTRGQMAAFLHRMMASPATPASCGFGDVPTSAYFAGPACWLKARGVTTGVGGNTSVFAPGDQVTRGQMAAFLWRLAGQPAVGTKAGFSDVSSSAYYAAAVDWLKRHGITTGVGGTNRFAPDESITRAQMAAFLHRLASTKAAWAIKPPPTVTFR